MNTYQLLFDGMALGFALGLLALYLLYRLKPVRPQKSKKSIDHLVEDIQDYYRGVSNNKNKDFE